MNFEFVDSLNFVEVAYKSKAWVLKRCALSVANQQQNKHFTVYTVQRDGEL